MNLSILQHLFQEYLELPSLKKWMIKLVYYSCSFISILTIKCYKFGSTFFSDENFFTNEWQIERNASVTSKCRRERG